MKPTFFCLIISIITLSTPFHTLASESPKVTIQNYIRAETDVQMQTYAEKFDAFGKFFHVREAYDVTSTDTLRFGGSPDQPNYLHIVPGWDYVVRLYKPRKEILAGTWKFPKPTEVK